MGRRRKKYFRFTEKTHSRKGMLALGLACVLLAVYGLFIAMAYGNQGTLSVYFGSAGVFAVVVSLVTLVLAVQSLREENSFRLFPRAAMVTSLLALAGWGGTYALGFLIQ